MGRSHRSVCGASCKSCSHFWTWYGSSGIELGASPRKRKTSFGSNQATVETGETGEMMIWPVYRRVVTMAVVMAMVVQAMKASLVESWTLCGVLETDGLLICEGTSSFEKVVDKWRISRTYRSTTKGKERCSNGSKIE